MSSAPLPSGRHHLSREQVVASQRSRMLAAMAEAMMEKGYVGTPVAEIIRRAGVSRETFYQQFRSKQDCFIQALDTGTDVLARLLELAADDRLEQAAAGGPLAPPAQFRRLLHIYLRTLADEPALARVFLVEVYAAGPEAMERRREVQGRFAEAIADIFDARTPDARFACDALVAATAQLVTTHLVTGDLDALRALEEPLAELADRLLG
ncbi:TetR/AcrR family transcriptional regulator [Streptomyces sp. A7024]|uniref:TetR/AcrR family transcriptional regulator n=1 Tax=Streptomyces coryli TaxID=1128680 RepID=A0A6G4TSB7_9ACTN|nr:TetR/AcrR family transcriptional regulator [Streptomyces coryli]NGN62672.1 TetR/AcrR family transcriptional regulator [Streptomyces coryli]